MKPYERPVQKSAELDVSNQKYALANFEDTLSFSCENLAREIVKDRSFRDFFFCQIKE
jgi:thioredoxin-related protein